jgi:hypothetical protein
MGDKALRYLFKQECRMPAALNYCGSLRHQTGQRSLYNKLAQFKVDKKSPEERFETLCRRLRVELQTAREPCAMPEDRRKDRSILRIDAFKMRRRVALWMNLSPRWTSVTDDLSLKQRACCSLTNTFPRPIDR